MDAPSSVRIAQSMEVPKETTEASNVTETITDALHRPSASISYQQKFLTKFYRDGPLELLMLAFSFLTPRDLLVLSRLCKNLRETLMSKKSKGVWKKALQAVDAPTCPTYLSLPEWTELIFGNGACFICGATRIRADMRWRLQRRLCFGCEYRPSTRFPHLITSQAIDKEFPANASVIKKIILSTGPLHDEYRDRPEDLLYMHSDAALVDAALRKCRSKDDAQYMIATHGLKVIQILRDAKSLGKTVSKYQKRLEDERAKEITARLLKRGWTERAINKKPCWEPGGGYHMRYGDGNSTTVLTENEWERILPLLEARVGMWTLIFHSEDVGARFFKVEVMWRQYLARIKPSVMASQPHWRDLCAENPLKSLIDSTRIDVSDKELRGSFKATRRAWRKKTRLHLKSLLPEAFRSRYKSGDYLKLAVAVFQRERPTNHCGCEESKCSDGQYCHCSVATGPVPLIGWEHAAVHHCGHQTKAHGRHLWKRQQDTPLSFNEHGSAAAASLIRLVGLDDGEARPEKLDKLGHLFFCENCPSVFQDGHWKKLAMTWRSCVMHQMHSSAVDTHESPRWVLLKPCQTPEAYQAISGQIDHREVWHCNLCSETMTEARRKPDVLEHIRTQHNISSPDVYYQYFADSWAMTISPPVMPWVPTDRHSK